MGSGTHSFDVAVTNILPACLHSPPPSLSPTFTSPTFTRLLSAIHCPASLLAPPITFSINSTSRQLSDFFCCLLFQLAAPYPRPTSSTSFFPPSPPTVNFLHSSSSPQPPLFWQYPSQQLIHPLLPHWNIVIYTQSLHHISQALLQHLQDGSY